MPESDLKSCQFCGGYPRWNSRVDAIVLCCDCCGGEVRATTRADTIEKWQRRVTADKVAALERENRELREAIDDLIGRYEAKAT